MFKLGSEDEDISQEESVLAAGAVVKDLVLTNEQCQEAVFRMWETDLVDHFDLKSLSIYGVPRGGIPVAYLLRSFAPKGSVIVDKPAQADVIVDDLIGTGATRDRYKDAYPKTPFVTMVDYIHPKLRPPGSWIIFPWEMSDVDTSADDHIVRLLQYIGEDPKRGGLLETPKRVLSAWKKEWASGYGKDPAQVLKCFEDGAANYDEMVIVKDIPFYSHCEHHMAPFFGTATIAYLPSKRIVGLSKIPRLLDIFARRLQVQERLTTQVADALEEHLKPRGVAVLIKARHLCMESRGCGLQGHATTTSALRGEFHKDRVRAEFLSIAR